MFVIVGRKGEDFIVKDTDDGVKERYSDSQLRKIIKTCGIQIKGVYPNGVTCIWSKHADKLNSLESGIPLVLETKKDGKTSRRVVLLGEFSHSERVFVFICDDGLMGLTDRYLVDNSDSIRISTDNCDALELARLLKIVKG